MEQMRPGITTRKPHIGISGSYGGLNLGDEAILQSIVAQIRRTLFADLTVFSRDANDTRRRHQVEQVVQFGELARRQARELVRGFDLLIIGGGGILYDTDAEMYLREADLAREVGVPVMIYAISAGPLVNRSVRAHVRDVLNTAAAITVRDRNTLQLLEEIGVEQEIMLTADPAVLLEAEPLTLDEILRAEAIDPQARLIGFSVREPGPAAPDLQVDHYHRLVANAADFVVDRLDAEVVFFPLERRQYDVQHSHGVVAQMRHAGHATVLKREYAPGQIVSLLDHFEFSIGMRLHFLIFSALAGLPFVALPYASKVSGFLQELGANSAPALQTVSAGQLLAHIDRAWDQREGSRIRVKQLLQELQRRAAKNHQCVIDLLSRRSPLRTDGGSTQPSDGT